MISIELNTLRLAFKDSPGVGDTYFDFIQPDSGSLNGFVLETFSTGDTGYNDKYKTEIITLTITGSLQVASVSDLQTRLNKLRNYFTQTYALVRSWRGNLPISYYGSKNYWLGGKGAVLTFQANGGEARFWDVLDGSVSRDGAIMTGLTEGYVQNVTVTIQARSKARGPHVTLLNLLVDGDFETEGGNYLSGLPQGWSSPQFTSLPISNTTAQYSYFPTSTLGQCPGGSKAFVVANGGTCTVYTSTLPSIAAPQNTAIGLNAVISWWWYYNPKVNGGSFTVGLQYESSPGVWADYTGGITVYNPTTQTYGIVSGPTLFSTTFPATNYLPYVKTTVGNWQKLQIGIQSFLPTDYRLKIVQSSIGSTGNYTNGFIATTGWSYWLNPDTFPAAPTEDLGGNWLANCASIRLYNIQGDTDAPLRMFVNDRASGGSSNLTYIMGLQKAALANNSGTGYDDVIKPLDFLNSTAATIADTTGAVLGGKWATTLTNTLGAQTVFSGPIPHQLDNTPRRYLAVLYYAANDTAGISKVSLTIGNTSQNFSVSLPQTYTGGASAGPSNYRMGFLGEMYYPQNPNNSIGYTTDWVSAGGQWSVVLTTAANTTGQISVIGVLMLPFSQFGMWEYTHPSLPSALVITSEGNLPAVDDSYSQTSYRLVGTDFRLNPGDNRMSILYLDNKDNSTTPPLLTPAATENAQLDSYYSPQRFWSFDYSPRYRLDL